MEEKSPSAANPQPLTPAANPRPGTGKAPAIPRETQETLLRWWLRMGARARRGTARWASGPSAGKGAPALFRFTMAVLRQPSTEGTDMENLQARILELEEFVVELSSRLTAHELAFRELLLRSPEAAGKLQRFHATLDPRTDSALVEAFDAMFPSQR